MAGHQRNVIPNGEAAVWQDLLRSLVSQGIPTLPEAQWQRVFLCMWFLGCLVATAAYTCNLVSIFTTITYQRHLRTIQELADSHYRYIYSPESGAEVP